MLLVCLLRWMMCWSFMTMRNSVGYLVENEILACVYCEYCAMRSVVDGVFTARTWERRETVWRRRGWEWVVIHRLQSIDDCGHRDELSSVRKCLTSTWRWIGWTWLYRLCTSRLHTLTRWTKRRRLLSRVNKHSRRHRINRRPLTTVSWHWRMSGDNLKHSSPANINWLVWCTVCHLLATAVTAVCSLKFTLLKKCFLTAEYFRAKFHPLDRDR